MILTIDSAAWGSAWRHMRVGEKLLLAVLLVITALVAPVWPGTVLVGCISCVLLLGSARIEARTVWYAVRLPLAFIILGAITVLVTVHIHHISAVDTVWSWGWFSITRGTITTASQLFIHAVCGTLAVMVFALTTPLSDFLNWLVDHRVPEPLVDVASLMYRLLFILWETAANMHDAQIRRLGSHPIRSWSDAMAACNHAGDIAGTLIVRAWGRAQRLNDGLAARGADISLKTTCPVPPRSRMLWLMMALSMVIVWVCVAVFRWKGWEW